MIRTMNASQVGKLFQRSANRVRELAAAGEIPAVRICGKWVFKSNEIAKMLGCSEDEL